MDCNPPDSSVCGILQARILESVATPSCSEDLPKPRIEPTSLLSPALAGGFFTTSTPFSRGSSHPGIELGSPALQSDSLPAELPENPNIYIYIEIYFIII